MDKDDYDFLEKIRLKKENLNEGETKRLIEITKLTFEELFNKIKKGEEKEIALFNQSLYFLLEKENRPVVNIEDVNIGDFYFANFLLEYENEIAYIHPILVLAKFNSSLLVVPGTTNNKFWKIGYHYIFNKKDSMKKYYKLTKSESGTNKDGTFFLNSFRAINVNKITKAEKIGTMSRDSVQFKEIYDYVFGKAFKNEQKKILRFERMDKEK